MFQIAIYIDGKTFTPNACKGDMCEYINNVNQLVTIMINTVTVVSYTILDPQLGNTLRKRKREFQI